MLTARINVMRNDKQIALTVIMFAERWKMLAWVDVKWDEEKKRFQTFILPSEENDLNSEVVCEIETLEQLAILLSTEKEFLNNVNVQINSGAIEAHDVDNEWLFRVAAARIMNVSFAFPYSMVEGDFTPDHNLIPVFTDSEVRSGEFALRVIEGLSITGLWWGEALEIEHVSKEWSEKAKHYVTSDSPRFAVIIVGEDSFRSSCFVEQEIDECDLPQFLDCVEDLTFAVPRSKWDLGDNSGSINSWISWLFIVRNSDVTDLRNEVLDSLPAEALELF